MAIFVREDIPTRYIDVTTESCDVGVVEVILGINRLRIAATYRSPTPTVSNATNSVHTDLKKFGTTCRSAPSVCLSVI